jgi:hypothetical protein
MRRWLVFLPAALLAFFGSTADASSTEGLTVTGYQWSGNTPTRSVEAYAECGSGLYPNIDQRWDGVAFGSCGTDYFMLRYSGWITLPAGATSVRFAIFSDDGSAVNVDGIQFGRWADQGCSISYSPTVTLAAGVPLPIEAWFYERGGATCFALWWQLDGLNRDWTVVPASAFSTGEPAVPSTTTALPPVSVSEPPTTTLPVVATTEMSTTTEAVPVPSTTESPVWLTTTTLDLPTVTAVGRDPVADTSVPTTTTEPIATTTLVPTTLPVESSLPTETLPQPDEVDLFDGSHDEVIPAGSTISIAQRRTVVAVSAVFFIAVPRPSSSSSSSSGSRRRR